jgi:hypothetical protein
VLAVLVAAPLAYGSVHDWARWPFCITCFAAGAASWLRARALRSTGATPQPVAGGRLLLLLNAFVVFQLIRWPVPVLGLLSPGSLELYWARWGGTHYNWLPITVYQRNTLRGLAFLLAVSCLYAAVFREFGDSRWARRLAASVVAVAAFMTLVGFLQRASDDPGRIYGIWKPVRPDAVFGPYVNRTHYAGHVVMAVPLALAFAMEGWRQLAQRWRERGLAALGDRGASALMLGTTVAMFIASGVLNSGSRTGIGVLVLVALAMPLFFWRRSLVAATLAAAIAAVVAYASADLGWVRAAFEQRGFRATRLAIWQDMWPIVLDFPLFGVGLNAFGRAYREYQTIYKWDYWGEAHNEYYQVLLDLGLVGALLGAALLWRLFGGAARALRAGPLEAGLFGALLSQAAANVVDFNWQIPANAATFAALAGVTLARAARSRSQGGGPALD